MIYYALAALAEPPTHRRVPLAQQRLVSRRLLAAAVARAGGTAACTDGGTSVSHSRGLAAAAVSTAGPVGIDIEWITPQRDGAGILAALFGLALPSVATLDFYRAWTFHEAWFKATGHVADAALVWQVLQGRSTRLLLRRGADGDPVAHLLQRQLDHDFSLSIVWLLQNSVPPDDPVLIELSRTTSGILSDAEHCQPSG